ncbi:MAG: hypothetical protein M3R43_07950 [Acidobacteriota bacterium]|nr:hypothetical protein [Acidobacteriota bacterium]
MGRNLYILAATLAVLALISVVLSFTNIAQQPGSPGDVALWRTTGIVLFCFSLIVALAGILSSLFEQAERRDTEARRQRRRR